MNSRIKLDLDRHARIGLEETIFCAGKSVEDLHAILDQAASANLRMLLSRLSREQYQQLGPQHRAGLDYDPISATAYYNGPHTIARDAPLVAIVAAGTSDSPVSREAARTLQYYGEPSLEVSDVGVTGLWRLLERVDELAAFPVVIAVAGMDAALPTVLAGLVPGLVIGVPTSVGYGVAHNGQTALHALLTSCAPGLVVMNIDNGFGAACAALRTLKLL